MPLVGITSYLEEASWGVWRRPAALLPQLYVDAVTAAGAMPVLLPPQSTDADRLLGRMDAVVFAGGPDLAPDHYGARPHPSTDPPQHPRDSWEFALLRAALARDLPVLGVCRGMQLLNVALGGDLIQHLPDLLGEEQRHRVAPATFHRHEVTVEPTSRLGSILGASARVPCYHHQAVARLGAGLRTAARSADGVVEAVELPDATFVLGVQWHPEAEPDDPRLFEALVTAALTAAVKETVS